MEQISFCLCLFIVELQLPRFEVGIHRVRMVPCYNTLDHGYYEVYVGNYKPTTK